MEKLPICRICLVQNVRMYIVVNKNLQELYEKLTDIPFVTEDRRPILACFVCCTKLKQCFQLLRKCLESEEQFVEMMYEDYEPNLLISQDSLDLYCGFIKSPVIHLSIVDELQTETYYIPIKQELPAVCEGLDDIIEPEEEHQSDEFKPENLLQSYLVEEDIPTHHFDSHSEDDIPLMEFKTEVVEEEVSEKKQKATVTKRATVSKKQKQDTQRKNPPYYPKTSKQTTKEKLDSKVNRTNQRYTSTPGTYFKEPFIFDQRTHTGVKPYKCDVCQRSFKQKGHLKTHVRIHTGEKPYKCNICDRGFSQSGDLTKHVLIHTGEKPFKCHICERSFNQMNNLTTHLRIHTGVKPYKCDVCQCSFKQRGNLNGHMRIHTGEKPYKCLICDRSLNQKTHLTTHMRTHTGVKPHKCDECHCNFKPRGHLHDHIEG